MPDHLLHLRQNLKSWAVQAQSKGWLNEREVLSIDATTTATPGSLFDTPNRPLVAGFFGGTGVGKSTLMNRFAGEAVARTSAERPTSREITIYVHESVSIANLPAEFPMHRMHTQTHQNNQYRSVLWIDMPDFDSVEQSNRDLVYQWLPHIDVVIYVVSPERYRDDDGWRLLLKHGTQHAWLFVINHWDRGHESQREDFANMLSTAGLSDPHLFCTDSSASDNSPTSLPANNVTDEFDAFRETLNALADQQLIDQLESRGVVQRFKQMRSVTDTLREQLSTPEQIKALSPLWQTQWSSTATELAETIDWKVAQVAVQYADKEQGIFAAIYARIRGTQIAPPAITPDAFDPILDDAFFDRIEESVDGFAQQATGTGLPVNAIQQPLNALKPDWRAQARTDMEAAISQSIALPGSKAHRIFHRILGWLCWLLPLAAMGWVGFRIINVFRLGADDSSIYLSGNFAIHGLLLLGMAWLIPTLLFIKLTPSREKAAARGVRTGVQRISEHISQQVQKALQNLSSDSEKRITELDKVLASGINTGDADLPASLKRMLIYEDPALTATGVRATTQV